MTFITLTAAAAEPLRCAFDGCQAGGVILERAPRVKDQDGESLERPDFFHPGCWAAYLNEAPF